MLDASAAGSHIAAWCICLHVKQLCGHCDTIGTDTDVIIQLFLLSSTVLRLQSDIMMYI